MYLRPVVLLFLCALPGLCDDWSPRRAAQYMDSRQKEWFGWPRGMPSGSPCVSCHTGMTYLLARPALRRALGQEQPTAYETGLLDALRAKVAKKDAQELAKAPVPPGAGVEAVFSALFLAMRDAESGALSAEAERAFEQLWSTQLREGKNRGAWPWFSLKQDPWEVAESAYFGASLAALAVGAAPGGYRDRPEVREHAAALIAYLERERANQPLHNRLALVWASSKLPAALPEPDRSATIREVLDKQQADGGWTVESLGPWGPHPEAPPAGGSNSYATAVVTFMLQRSGVPGSHPGLVKARAWLRSHQDPEGGYWAAESMNRRYEEPMPLRFMRDAATAFASLALLEGR